MTHATSEPTEAPSNFIRDMVQQDVANGRFDAAVVTRFPPEPNGFLHLGHAFAAMVSYRIASEFGGRFHLRFDDTNPTKENIDYVEAQQRDLKWLGVDWGEKKKNTPPPPRIGRPSAEYGRQCGGRVVRHRRLHEGVQRGR